MRASEVLQLQRLPLPVVLVVSLLAIADGLDHAEQLGVQLPEGVGWRLGFGLVLMLISLIGGRIIPSFTRNWLAKHGRQEGLPTQPGRFDVATLATTAVALAAWVAVPDTKLAGALLLAASVLQCLRLARWSGLRTLGEPLVFILHAAYAWLPLGLLLLGASIFSASIPAASALHALGAGAMASMTLAVMTRATRGHTGRMLVADAWTKAIYALVTAGAALRVAAPFLPIDYLDTIKIGGTLWAGAFALFALVYGPMLVSARSDGKP